MQWQQDGWSSLGSCWNAILNLRISIEYALVMKFTLAMALKENCVSYASQDSAIVLIAFRSAVIYPI